MSFCVVLWASSTSTTWLKQQLSIGGLNGFSFRILSRLWAVFPLCLLISFILSLHCGTSFFLMAYSKSLQLSHSARILLVGLLILHFFPWVDGWISVAFNVNFYMEGVFSHYPGPLVSLWIPCLWLPAQLPVMHSSDISACVSIQPISGFPNFKNGVNIPPSQWLWIIWASLLFNVHGTTSCLCLWNTLLTSLLPSFPWRESYIYSHYFFFRLQ